VHRKACSKLFPNRGASTAKHSVSSRIPTLHRLHSISWCTQALAWRPEIAWCFGRTDESRFCLILIAGGSGCSVGTEFWILDLVVYTSYLRENWGQTESCGGLIEMLLRSRARHTHVYLPPPLAEEESVQEVVKQQRPLRHPTYLSLLFQLLQHWQRAHLSLYPVPSITME